MTDHLDDGLRALSQARYEATLDGLEGAIWSAVEQRRQNAMTPGLQMGVAAAALALGLAFGLGANLSKPHPYAAELQVLSDDSIAPSIRIGGV
jgi:hypothetical protein